MENPRKFRGFIVSLQYITMTKPNVQVVVNILLQFMATPKPTHWAGVKRILRYLPGTQKMGLLLKGGGLRHNCLLRRRLYGGGDTIDRKSRTEFLVYVGGTLVS